MHLLVRCPASLYCVKHGFIDRFIVDVHRGSAGSQEIRTCFHQETQYLLQCEGFLDIDVGTYPLGREVGRSPEYLS